MRRAAAALVLLAFVIAPAWAQSPPGKPPTCAAPEHRRFDFWIGTWDVTNPAGKVVGHNRIESALGGCALIEHWTGAGGVRGTSLNAFDRDRRKWHQTWVDNTGGLLQLDGGVEGGAMVMTGDAVDKDAPSGVARQRITWTPQPGGTVRQRWESSSDGGKTWNVVFDGLYRRAARPQTPR